MIVIDLKELPQWRYAYRGYKTPGRISAAPSGVIYGVAARANPGACHIDVVSPLSTSPS